MHCRLKHEQHDRLCVWCDLLHCHFRQLVLLVMKARGVQLGGIDRTVRCAVA
jgi:hypothetical protein